MLLDCKTYDDVIMLLQKYNQEANDIRDMVAQLVIFTEGNISYSEAWQMTHDDRISIKRAVEKLNQEYKKQSRK